jgi:integrase/recombinase XerD
MARLREGKAGRLDSRDPLFRSRKGGVLGRQAIYRVVRRAAARAGVPRKVGPHSMRHSFASHLITGGADLRAVQEMLGHSSVATTQVYTKVENRWLKEVHEKFHPRA